jgi:hypothetical protein
MTMAIVFGVVILGLIIIAGIYVSRAMREGDANKPQPDGSGAEGPDGDSGGGEGGD